MRALKSFLLAGSAVAAISLPLAAQAQVALYKQGGLEVDGTFTAGGAVVSSVNPGFGAGVKNTAGVRQTGDLNGLEGYIKPGLAATYDIGTVNFYGAADFIAAATRGDGDANFPSDSTSGHPNKVRWEDLYVGVKSGKLLPQLGTDAVDLSVGRQTFVIGDSFLIGDGNADGGKKAAYWLAPRTAFARTAIAKIETGTPVRGDIFMLQNDSSQDDNLAVSQPAHTKLFGGNLEWINKVKGSDGKEAKAWTIGGTFVHIYDADVNIAATRDGMNVYDIRANGAFIPSLPDLGLAGEYVYEHNGSTGKKLSAGAYYLQPSWTFSNLPWTPKISYRYAHFSGTPQGASKSEAYDPLFYGAAGGYGTWYMGEIVGQYVLFNSNDNVNMLHVKFQPTDTIDFGVIGYNFRFDERPAGVTSKNAFNELDVYGDYSPLSWLSFTGAVAAAKAQSGGKQYVSANGAVPTNDRTWYLFELGATVHF